MASQEEPEQDNSNGKNSKRRMPLKPVVQKRLETCYEHATKQFNQEKYDYANNLYMECLSGDPGNLTYLQAFITNLKKKYGDPKKVGGLFGFGGGRSAVKKALSKSAWDDALQAGWEVLKTNPWDAQTLVLMGAACEGAASEGEGTLYSCFLDCQLFYLKCAYEASRNDADICKILANACHKQNRLDDSISFWHKFEQLRPNDPEAQREIASLLVEKQVNEARDNTGKLIVSTGKKDELTPEERLKRRVDRQPDDISGYHALAQFYVDAERFSDAEAVYQRALAIAKNDVDLREKIEEMQVRQLRAKEMKATAKFKETGAENDKKELDRAHRATLARELEMLKGRCERYPSQLVFRYDLAVRYQLMGEYQKAIAEFQAAKNDPRKKGACLLRLGKCFHHIKQFQLALQHYELAISEIPDREAEDKKEAIYRAGKLALGLNLLDQAEKHLNHLAGMDFSYRDISKLLDDLQQKRKQGPGRNNSDGGPENQR